LNLASCSSALGSRPAGCQTYRERDRYRANIAHVRQSRPDSVVGFQMKSLKPFNLFPLRAEADLRAARHDERETTSERIWQIRQSRLDSGLGFQTKNHLNLSSCFLEADLRVARHDERAVLEGNGDHRSHVRVVIRHLHTHQTQKQLDPCSCIAVGARLIRALTERVAVSGRGGGATKSSFNLLDLYYTSPESGERQCRSGTRTRRFDSILSGGGREGIASSTIDHV